MFLFRAHATKQDLEHQKCRWCHHKIGHIEHAPIPLCTSCFKAAYGTPNSQRMMVEFNSEWHEYARRLQKDRPSRLDVLTETQEVIGGLRELGARIDEAVRRRDVAEVDRLSEQMRQQIDAIARYRTEAMTLVTRLEEEP